MSALLGGLGGLFKGFAQGQIFKEGKQERMSSQKQKEKLLDLQMEGLKMKAEEQKLRNEYIRSKMQPSTGEAPSAPSTPSAPLSESFAGQSAVEEADVPDVLDQIVKGQGNEDPFMEHLMGFGQYSSQMQRSREHGERQEARWAGIEQQNLSREQRKELADRRYSFDITKAQQEYITKEIVNPDGSISYQKVPKYPGIAAGGAPSLGAFGEGGRIQKSPAKHKLPILGSELSAYVNIFGEQPGPGQTPEALHEQGFKKMSPAQIDQFRGFGQVTDTLLQVDAMMQDVFPTSETMGEFVTGAVKRAVGAKTQVNVEAAALKKFVSGTLAPIIRTLGEKGALSDTDIKRAQALMADMTDRADVAWRSLKELRIMVGNAKLNRMGFKFKDAEQVKEAYDKGAIHRDVAEWQLRFKFGMSK